MAWEATALDLLETAGVRAPQHQLTQVGNRSILILRRFDRTRDGGRIGYISAMTATGSSDGDQKDYADLAEAIRDLSRSPVQDLHEFYDRIIASIALGNTDDHLRNHGFLADRGLWRLSPAFDVNPNPDPSRPPCDVDHGSRRDARRDRRAPGYRKQLPAHSIGGAGANQTHHVSLQAGGARRGRTESSSGRSP